MRIVAVEAFKGGTGKSTTAYFLSRAWASQGHRTLLIGTSPQNDLLNFLAGRHDIHSGLREVLAGKGAPTPISVTPLLQVMPAGYDTSLDLTPIEVRDRVLRLAADSDCERVVVDGYGLVDLVSWGAVAASDVLLIPCTIDPEPVRAVVRLWKGLEAQRSHPHTRDLLPATARVLLSAVPAPSARTRGVQRLLDQILESWAPSLCATQIRRSARFVDLDTSIDSYSGARRSEHGPLQVDYQNLARELDALLERRHSEPAC